MFVSPSRLKWEEWYQVIEKENRKSVKAKLVEVLIDFMHEDWTQEWVLMNLPPNFHRYYLIDELDWLQLGNKLYHLIYPFLCIGDDP